MRQQHEVKLRAQFLDTGDRMLCEAVQAISPFKLLGDVYLLFKNLSFDIIS